MSHQVFDFKELDRKNIILKKAVFNSKDYYTIPLKYRQREIDSEIIFQTPNLPIHNGITEYTTTNGRKKFSVDFSLQDEDINTDVKLFKKFIANIDKFIKTKSKSIWKKKNKKEIK